MKKSFKKLLILIGIVGTILNINGCSKEKEVVNPLQQYLGTYDCYIGGLPGTDDLENFLPGDGYLTVTDTLNKIRIIRFTPIYYNSVQKLIFTNCEFVPIDTTGNKSKPFARIMNKGTGLPIGEVTFAYYWSKTSNIFKTRLGLQMDVMDNDNQRLRFFAVKRRF